MIPVEGRLRSTPDGTLTHVADPGAATGQPIHGPDSMTWRVKTADLSMAAAPSSVRWLHESHPRLSPLICSGRLICADADEGLPAWLVEERVGTALSPLQQKTATAPRRRLAHCLRGMLFTHVRCIARRLPSAIASRWRGQQRWRPMADGAPTSARVCVVLPRACASRYAGPDYFVESVEEPTTAPRRKGEARRTGGAIGTGGARTGLSVAGGVCSYAYFAGEGGGGGCGGCRCAWPSAPRRAACAQVNGAVLRAASDLVTDLGDSAHAVMGESAEAITKAVKHTQGDAAAEVADDALSGAAGGATWSSPWRPSRWSRGPPLRERFGRGRHGRGTRGPHRPAGRLRSSNSPQGPGDQGNVPGACERVKWPGQVLPRWPATGARTLLRARPRTSCVCDEASEWLGIGSAVACESGTAEPSGGVGRSWGRDKRHHGGERPRRGACSTSTSFVNTEQPVFVPVD